MITSFIMWYNGLMNDKKTLSGETDFSGRALILRGESPLPVPAMVAAAGEELDIGGYVLCADLPDIA
jgi:hypothetical protein